VTARLPLAPLLLLVASFGLTGSGCAGCGSGTSGAREASTDVPRGDVSNDIGGDLAPSVEGRACQTSPTCGSTAWCNPATSVCQLRSRPAVRSFSSDIYPLFRSRGCVGCHTPGGPGTVTGTAGVPLIFDAPARDAWSALVAGGSDCSDGLARRVCVDEPRYSLFARVPLQLPGQPPHTTATVFLAFESWDAPELQTMLEWIAQGATFDGTSPPDAGIDRSANDMSPDRSMDLAADGPGPVVDAVDAPVEAPRVDATVDNSPDLAAPDSPPPGPDAGIDLPVDSPPPPADAQDTGTPTDSAPADVAVPDTTPPAGGLILSIAPASCQSAVVSWTAGTDDRTPVSMLAYDLCWSTSAAGCPGTAGSHMPVAGPATSATIGGLTVATTYYATVRVIDLAGNVSTPAPATSFVIPANFGNAPLPQPGGLMATSAATTIDLSWTGASSPCVVPGSLSYQICASTDPAGCGSPNGAWATSLMTSAGATTARLTGLTPATAYTIFLRSTDPGGATSIPVSTSAITKYSFATNVVPVITNSCNGSVCHVGIASRTVSTDYATLIAGSGGITPCLRYVTTDSIPGNSFIYAITQGPACGSGTMPIAAAGVAAFRGWLLEGAPNN
jgi:hypothetical protein